MNEKELLVLLAIAVNSAETWYGDSRGPTGDEGLDDLRQCYEALEGAGFKTKRTHPDLCWRSKQMGVVAVIIDDDKTVA